MMGSVRYYYIVSMYERPHVITLFSPCVRQPAKSNLTFDMYNRSPCRFVNSILVRNKTNLGSPYETAHINYCYLQLIAEQYTTIGLPCILLVKPIIFQHTHSIIGLTFKTSTSKSYSDPLKSYNVWIICGL